MKKTALSLLVVAASGAYVWHEAGGAVTDGLLAATPPDSVALAGNIGKRSQTLAAAAPATGTPAIPTALTEAPAAKEDKTESIALPSNEPLPPPPAMLAVPKPTVTPRLAETSPLPGAPSATSREPFSAPIAIPLPRPRPADRIEPGSGLVMPAAMSFASSLAYADGAYTGPAVDAYYGYVQIQAIIEGSRLSRIKVLQYPSDRRTSVFINRQALPMLRDEVISAQTADVDIISGATLTSEAFIRSLDAALRKAGS